MSTRPPSSGAWLLRSFRRLSELSWRTKLLLAGVVYMTGVWSMWSGPIQGAELGLLQVLHGGFRMFLLDAPGVPAPAASLAVTTAYWTAAFAAPLVAAGAFADAVRAAVRSLGSAQAQTRRMSGHVVICGLGRHGALVAEEARKKGLDVAAVDRDAPANGWRSVSRRHGEAVVPVVESDLLDLDDWWEAVAADRAAQIWLCSGDPLRNLQLALELPAGLSDRERRVIAVVDRADLGELTQHLGEIELFDEYGAVAKAMVDGALQGPSGPGRSIAIVGFGRLGKAVLRALFADKRMAETNPNVQLVDPKLPEGFRPTVEKRPVASTVYRRSAEHWIEDASLFGGEGDAAARPSTVFSCVDDDRANLALLSARLRHTGSYHLSLRVLQPISEGRFPGVHFHQLTELQRDAVRKRLSARPTPDSPARAAAPSLRP